jgi:hypothetical protein
MIGPLDGWSAIDVWTECPSYTPTFARPSIALSLALFMYGCLGGKAPTLPPYRLVDVDGIGNVNINEHPVYIFFSRVILWRLVMDLVRRGNYNIHVGTTVKQNGCYSGIFKYLLFEYSAKFKHVFENGGLVCYLNIMCHSRKCWFKR